jgi:hypothetical protein
MVTYHTESRHERLWLHRTTLFVGIRATTFVPLTFHFEKVKIGIRCNAVYFSAGDCRHLSAMSIATPNLSVYQEGLGTSKAPCIGQKSLSKSLIVVDEEGIYGAPICS